MGEAEILAPENRWYVRGRPVPGASQWLTDHWEEYAGQWVAVGPLGLLCAAGTLDELEARIGSLRGALIAHVV